MEKTNKILLILGAYFEKASGTYYYPGCKKTAIREWENGLAELVGNSRGVIIPSIGLPQPNSDYCKH